MRSHTISFETPRTTRIVRMGGSLDPQSDEVDPAVKHLLIGLHGYGQQVADFAQTLAPVASEERRVVAPEALSRFYTRHEDRRTGSSWMTAEAREYEILDYVRYLDAVAFAEAESLEEDVSWTVLCFSQGCPAGCRWLANGTVRVDKLILWGADQAHDLSPEEWDALARVGEVVIVAGSTDVLFPSDRVEASEKVLRENGCTVRVEHYEGGHEIRQDVLLRLV